jgi:hypothetical protein
VLSKILLSIGVGWFGEKLQFEAGGLVYSVSCFLEF